MRLASLLVLTGCWSSSQRSPELIHNAAPQGAAPSVQVPPHSVWRGLYTCAQGTTAVVLVLDIASDHTVQAVFEFGPYAENPDLPAGSFRLTGTAKEDGPKLAIELVPARWIRQPPGYEMVGLSAVTGSKRVRLRGRITDPACSTFDVTRSD